MVINMKKVISYILLISWIILIFILSNQTGEVSGSESSSILYNIFNVIFNIFNLDTSNLSNFISIIHEPIRELMHALEYFILGILLINVLKYYNIKNIVTVAIMMCLIYSITDELHQLFISGRTLQYFDLLMDNIGSILGVILYNKSHKNRNDKIELI